MSHPNPFRKTTFLRAAVLVLTAVLLVACNRDESSGSNAPSAATSAHPVPVGAVYRTFDDKTTLTIISAEELEYRKRGRNLVCKYSSLTPGKVRVVMNESGTTQSLYFEVISAGLRGE